MSSTVVDLRERLRGVAFLEMLVMINQNRNLLGHDPQYLEDFSLDDEAVAYLHENAERISRKWLPAFRGDTGGYLRLQPNTPAEVRA